MARADDRLLLEACGSYKNAEISARTWAKAVCKLGIQSQFGVTIGLARGAGWSVYLERHDGGRISAPRNLKILT